MTVRTIGITLGLFAWLYGVAVILAGLTTSTPDGVAVIGFCIAFIGGFLFRYSRRHA